MNERVTEQPSTRLSEYRMRMIESAFPIGTWQLDLATGTLFFSPGMFRILGFDPTLIRPSFFLLERLVHPEDVSLYRAPDRETAHQVSSSFRVIRLDGSTRWMQNVWSSHDRPGETAQLVGTMMDVTDAVQSRRELASSNFALGTIAKAIEKDVCITDEQANVVLEAGLEHSERPPASHYFERVHAADLPQVELAWRSARTDRVPFSVSFRLRDPGHKRVYCHVVPLDEELAPRQWLWTSSTTPDGEIHQARGELELSAGEIRAARAFLNWTSEKLAEISGVSFSTVRRLEKDTVSQRRNRSSAAVRLAFEAAGVAFRRDQLGPAVIMRVDRA